jgi:hypothetical protein
VQSSGESPTTLTSALAVVIDPDMPPKATSKEGVSPVDPGESPERSSGVFSETARSVQPEIATPEEFFTVRVADVNVPVPAVFRVKDSH